MMWRHLGAWWAQVDSTNGAASGSMRGVLMSSNMSPESKEKTRLSLWLSGDTATILEPEFILSVGLPPCSRVPCTSVKKQVGLEPREAGGVTHAQ